MSIIYLGTSHMKFGASQFEGCSIHWRAQIFSKNV